MPDPTPHPGRSASARPGAPSDQPVRGPGRRGVGLSEAKSRAIPVPSAAPVQPDHPQARQAWEDATYDGQPRGPAGGRRKRLVRVLHEPDTHGLRGRGPPGRSRTLFSQPWFHLSHRWSVVRGFRVVARGPSCMSAEVIRGDRRKCHRRAARRPEGRCGAAPAAPHAAPQGPAPNLAPQPPEQRPRGPLPAAEGYAGGANF